MNTDTQSFQPENSNSALGLQGITTSLYAKPKHHGRGGSYHSNISVLCDHNSFKWLHL